MSEWKKVKLGDCCHSISDGDHLPPPKSESGVPFITIANIDVTNHIDFGNTMFVPFEYYDNLNGIRKAKCNDILYSVVGSFGKPVLIKENIPFAFQRHIAILRPNNEIAESRFLYYIMLTRDFYMQADAVAIGAAQRTISLTALRNMQVELPPMEIQHRIATILSRYDSLIENYQKQIKLLEEAAQRLYKEWFVDLRFPGYENTKIVDGVPEGWEKKRLDKIFTYVRGKSYTSKELADEGTLMVNLKNIQAFGGYKRDAEKRYLGAYKDEQSLNKGDLVMGVTDMTQERRLVGHVALIPDFNESATFSMDLIKILPIVLSKTFLYCAMRFGGLSKKISPLANGVNVLHLKPEAMMGLEMIIPSKDVIRQFDNYFNNIFDIILNSQSQIRLLTEARDRLLPKLMSGEIAV
jgi:type I restriction enzyme S subunit